MQYEGKYFEHNVKKEIFWIKLIFESKKKEHDFVRTLIKMDKFHIFSTEWYSNMAIKTTCRQRYASEFLMNIPKCKMFN